MYRLDHRLKRRRTGPRRASACPCSIRTAADLLQPHWMIFAFQATVAPACGRIPGSAYALGRTIEFSDADDVDEIMANLSEDGYRVRSMIREIALSPLFGRK